MAENLLSTEGERVRLLGRMTRAFMQNVPHNVALGIEVVSLGDRQASMKLPFSELLRGVGEQSGLHELALTSLMDACCGAAVFMALDQPRPVATLDLRVDYLQASQAGRGVVAEAHCYRLSGEVAYVRCRAFHSCDEEPLAEAAGAFMLDTKEHATGAVAKEATDAAERLP